MGMGVNIGTLAGTDDKLVKVLPYGVGDRRTWAEFRVSATGEAVLWANSPRMSASLIDACRAEAIRAVAGG